MRRRIAVALCATAIAVTGTAAGATASPSRPDPAAIAAKTCGPGFTHAVIHHKQKCLRRGEFCAHRYRRQYRRYGYDCVKRDRRGNYHLT